MSKAGKTFFIILAVLIFCVFMASISYSIFYAKNVFTRVNGSLKSSQGKLIAKSENIFQCLDVSQQDVCIESFFTKKYIKEKNHQKIIERLKFYKAKLGNKISSTSKNNSWSIHVNRTGGNLPNTKVSVNFKSKYEKDANVLETFEFIDKGTGFTVNDMDIQSSLFLE